MGFISRKGISYKSLFYLLLCLWQCGSDGVESGFKIYRSKHDIFTNLECIDSASGYSEGDFNRTVHQCDVYDANCVSESNCKYCVCSRENKNTLIITIDYGVAACKSDEDIVAVPVTAFKLQNTEHNQCLKAESPTGKFIIGANCESSTHDMQWMWIYSAYNKQLMNMRTLKCMKEPGSDGGNITMTQCQITSKMFCARWPNGLEIRWKKRHVFPWPVLQLSDALSWGLRYAISKYHVTWNKLIQFWNKGRHSVCPINTDYKGCYRFSDGSYMAYLEFGETGLKQTKINISAPIFTENSDCQIQRTLLTRNGEEWEALENETPFTLKKITSDTIESQVNSKEQFVSLNGSLLKIIVSCKQYSGISVEEHCVLFKLESLPRYNEMSPTSGSGGTNSAAIAVIVTLLLVALAVALGFLIYYRRRKRSQVPQSNNNVLGTVNCCEEPDRTYETLKEGGNEVPPNQPGTTSDIYSYPDSNIANLPSSEQEYAYATDTDFPVSSVGTKPGAKRPINNGVVYQTLEQPGQPSKDDLYNYPDNTNIAKPSAPSELEYSYAKDTDLPKGNPNTKLGASQPGQPSDDNFYSYPENTNIAKPPSSELEYTYAKDTDIPKVTADKKTVPEQPPTTGLYKLPGTNIPTELEYSYAKDTDIPRVTVDKKTVPEEPTSDAVYHTLEQEPPNTDLYKLPGTNIPTELEYTYAKDTDIPRITTDTKSGAKGNSAPTASDA